MNKNKKRIYILDIIRGILIIYVVYYHLMYDLSDILSHEISYLYSDWFSAIRDIMSGSLIFISGISCNFSHSNVLRGIKTIAAALMLSLITILVIPSQTILFGILHHLGLNMLIFGIIKDKRHGIIKEKDKQSKNNGRCFSESYNKKTMIWHVVASMACLCMFFVMKEIYFGYLSFGFTKVFLPNELYGSFIMFIMGFGGPFMSADYYPVFPWSMLFYAGALLGYYFRKEELPAFFYKNFCKPLSFIGRHTMAIYLLHQPSLFGIFFIVNMIL